MPVQQATAGGGLGGVFAAVKKAVRGRPAAAEGEENVPSGKVPKAYRFADHAHRHAPSP